jgi:hypothetical protein
MDSGNYSSLLQKIEEESRAINKATKKGNWIIVSPCVYQLLIEAGCFGQPQVGCAEGVF